MITRRKAAVAAAAVLLLGAGPILAEEDSGSPNEAPTSVTVDIVGRPLELRINDAEPLSFELPVGATADEFPDLYDDTETYFLADVRSAFAVEDLSRISVRATPQFTGMTQADLNGLVFYFYGGASGNLEANFTPTYPNDFLEATGTCATFDEITATTTLTDGSFEKIMCSNILGGFDSITGDSTKEPYEVGFALYFSGGDGPTKLGSVTVDFLWIIEAQPES